MAGIVVEGVLTRSVRDTAGVLEVLARPWVGAPYVAPSLPCRFLEAPNRSPGKLRIGVLKRDPGSVTPVDESCVAAVDGAARSLEGLGHRCEESHPEALDDARFQEFAPNLLPFAFAAHALDWWARRLGEPLVQDELDR